MEISIPQQQGQCLRFGAGDWRRFPAMRKSTAVQFADRSHENYYCCKLTTKSNEKIKNKIKNKKKKKMMSSVEGLTTNQKLQLLRTFSETDHITVAAEVFLKKLDEMQSVRNQPRRMAESSSSSSASSSSSSSESESEDNCRQGNLEEKRENEETVKIDEKKEAEISRPGRVEVCMGGKCKKFGAESVMAEFQRQTEGTATEVTTCKCMGKCKSAPNVRLSDDSLSTNPLFLGVSVDGVAAILDSLFPPPLPPLPSTP